MLLPFIAAAAVAAAVEMLRAINENIYTEKYNFERSKIHLDY